MFASRTRFRYLPLEHVIGDLYVIGILVKVSEKSLLVKVSEKSLLVRVSEKSLLVRVSEKSLLVKVSEKFGATRK